MKALFWNVGRPLTDKKLELISEAVTVEKPDILCIAEGSPSISDCQRIIDVLLRKDYKCYYSPLSYQIEELKLGYGFIRNGLKIFTRDTIFPTAFSFSYQRHDGRIVVIKVYNDFKLTTFIFIHNKAKSGNPEVTLDQMPMIYTIKDMITIGKITDDIEKVESMGERMIIMGDFNLEPWDNVLKHKDFLRTCFFQNHNLMNQRSRESEKRYFNPSADAIFKSSIENLGGTYYSDNTGWALFDFILYNTQDGNIDYDIITGFAGGSDLLNCDIKISKSFLNHELDHLPIIAKIDD